MSMNDGLRERCRSDTPEAVVEESVTIRITGPEYHLYAQSNPRRAGELTHREAGYVTEIVTAAALRHGYNVLVDGSLRDYEWYREYFAGRLESSIRATIILNRR